MKKCCPSLRRVPLTVPLQRLFFQAVRTGVFSCRCADVRHRAVRKNTHEAVLGLRVLLRHRVGRHDWHAGVQRITRMLMRHRDVRKNRHEGEQRSTNAGMRHRAVRKDTQADAARSPAGAASSCGQKRHTRRRDGK